MVRGEQFYLTQEVEGEPNAFTTVELIENRGAHGLYRAIRIRVRNINCAYT